MNNNESAARFAIARFDRLLLVIAVFAAGCNGGPVDTNTAGIDGTGAPATPAAAPTVAYGTITALGSIWVNGVHFDTSTAVITYNGHVGTENDLHVGDIALVLGTLNPDGITGITGVATHIEIDDAVEGPIASIDLVDRSLVVLGQTVRIDADTSFTNNVPQRSLAGLAPLDVVEVFGFRGSNGDIHATRVGLQPFDQREFDTTGTVSNLDDTTKRFDINSLVVDYSTAQLQGFANGAIANGDAVEARGVSLQSNGEFVASSVEKVFSAPLLGNVGDRVEVEGFITGLYQFPLGFTAAGFVVKTNDNTVYEGGAYFGIALDVKVEVEGVLETDRSILASKVRFVRSNPIVIAAPIDFVNLVPRSFETLGFTVTTDVLTRVEDLSAVPLQPFNVSSLVPGDYVEVRGVQSPTDSREVLASLIERHDMRPDVRLEGYVESIQSVQWTTPTTGTFTILGVTISTDSATHFPMPNGREISADTFFFDLTPGSLLDVRGVTLSDGVIQATSVGYIN